MDSQKNNKHKPEVIKNELCPMCHTKNLTMMQEEIDVPYFGKTLVFSMTCTNCHYHVADIESIDEKPPVKQSIQISNEDDLKIRVVKSSQATVKIPRIATIEPGPASQGYITNVEGILRRIKHQIETVMEDSNDKSEKKKARNLLKKINRVMWGDETIKLIIEDPSGNSAIISDKVVNK